MKPVHPTMLSPGTRATRTRLRLALAWSLLLLAPVMTAQAQVTARSAVDGA
jgi:hypothetical protein